jgi:type VI protein secretion system component Hcp
MRKYALFTVCWALPVYAQTSFIGINGLGCQASAVQGSGEIQALSVKLGGTREAPPPGGSGGSNRVAFTGVTVERENDSCTPALLQLAAVGTLLPKVDIIVFQRQEFGAPVATLTTTLTDVLLTSFQITASSANAQEVLILQFGKISMRHASGTSACWDLVKAESCSP